MAMKLLNGLRAVEVSNTPRAGFCGKMFVDAGAEVIKLSLPGPYDPAPFSNWLDRGKSSVVIDWATREGKALLHRLLETADVLISDRECEGEGYELADVAKAHRRLVHVSTSDLGHAGPFAGRPSTNLIVAALSGMCFINGEAGRLPLREPGDETAIVAGIAAYMGALTALTNRSRTDEGQAVEVSALEAMVNVLSPSVLQCSYQDGAPRRRASADGFLFDCADGKVSLMTYRQLSWDTLLALWGIELDAEVAELLSTEQGRNQHMQEIRAALAPVLSKKTRQEIMQEICSMRIPCGMVLHPAELLSDPHLQERESFDRIVRPATGRSIFPGPGFRVAGERAGADREVPLLGGQTASILSSLPNEEVVA